MEIKEFDDLIRAAVSAREHAFAPYSNFKVGAALRTADGEIVSGCNVESAVYGATACAERVAVWKAVSEGRKEFSAIAVVADTEVLTPPCGICRQVIWELCGDIPVVFANLDGKKEILQMKDLLPRAFDGSFLS